MQELQERDPRRVGPYRLAGRLGAGGMGRVYVGRSSAGRLVAVKVIHEELAADPEFLARFTREIAAAKRVSGMFTASVVDADTTGPELWLATVYVPGPSLTEAVRDHGPLPVASARAWRRGSRIGNGAPFEVGTSVQFTATAGVLYLGVNDDNVARNSGSWTINIKKGGGLPRQHDAAPPDARRVPAGRAMITKVLPFMKEKPLISCKSFAIIDLACPRCRTNQANRMAVAPAWQR